MPSRRYKDRASWLKARHKGIGASDAPVILGLSPWASPYSLWCEKINPPMDLDSNLAMRIGADIEKTISEIYQKETGHRLTNPGRYTISSHADYPWMLATIDRDAAHVDGFDGEGVAEIKNVTEYKLGDWKEGAPLLYQVQLQHQLAVTGRAWGVLIALVGGNKLIHHFYRRDNRLIAAMIPKLERFHECCHRRTCPPMDGHEATREALERTHPFDTADAVALDAGLKAHQSRLAEITVLAKQLEEEEQALKNEIRASIGNGCAGYLPDGTGWTWKAQETARTLKVSPAFEEQLKAAGVPYEHKGGTSTRVLRAAKRKG